MPAPAWKGRHGCLQRDNSPTLTNENSVTPSSADTQCRQYAQCRQKLNQCAHPEVPIGTRTEPSWHPPYLPPFNHQRRAALKTSFGTIFAHVLEAWSKPCDCVQVAETLIGVLGTQALASPVHGPALQILTLALENKGMGDAGAQALAALRASSTLQTLQLCLHQSDVHDGGAAALAQLRHAPALRELSIDLLGNKVGNVGAEALGSLGSLRSSSTSHFLPSL